ncbi:MAG: OsmC family protein [Chloroflexota bacterium]
MTIHRYATALAWTGSTGGGYGTYARGHTVSAAPATTTLALSSDPIFGGDPSRLNPEQLLVMAASSCQLLSFLAAAARAGIDVLGYDDAAEGTMDDARAPAAISSIVLRPVIRVAAGTDVVEVQRLVEFAHADCYIANSLRGRVAIEADVVVAREGD